MLICEFNELMGKKVFSESPSMKSKPSFRLAGFTDIEDIFLQLFAALTGKPFLQTKGIVKNATEIEGILRDKQKGDVVKFLDEYNIVALFNEKQMIKDLSAQVDTDIHTYGILLALAEILDPDEKIEELSLGAGTGGKPFDVKTTKRVAEFKFAEWTKSRNAIRQNGIFKDFLELALRDDCGDRQKYIYCYSANAVIKFLANSRRSLDSVLSRNTKHKKYPDIETEYGIVKDFYDKHKSKVIIFELKQVLGLGD